jgi:hypothetical protein
VQNYTRRLASDLLRILARWPEANTAEVVTALNQFAADEDAPLDDRCEAIRTLGALDKKSYPEKNLPAVARTIALLVADVGRQTQAIEAPAVPAAAEPEAEAETPADAGAETADAPAVDAEGAAAADGAAVAGAGDKPADAAAAVAENAAAEGAVPAAGAAPVAEAPVVKANSLPPDLQAYFLLCLRCGVSGPPDTQGRGLGSAASADNKQLLADMVGKVDEMLAVLKRKKREDKLNETEIRKLQDLAAGVEAIVGGDPQDADGTTEQAAK